MQCQYRCCFLTDVLVDHHCRENGTGVAFACVCSSQPCGPRPAVHPANPSKQPAARLIENMMEAPDNRVRSGGPMNDEATEFTAVAWIGQLQC